MPHAGTGTGIEAGRDGDLHLVRGPVHCELADGRDGDGRAGGKSGTERASTKVAAGNLRVSRLLASCGSVLAPTLMPTRAMRKAAWVTRPPETMMVPVTPVVLPTTSLLMPKALSGTRNPATDPADRA